MMIYCCQCAKEVDAQLTNGREIYPHRPDLHDLPFWKCDTCYNYVGCHYKSKNRTNPLGCIPNSEMRKARRHIHDLIDPVWKSGKIGRSSLYQQISAQTGKPYHTANIRTIEEARAVYRAARDIIRKREKKDETRKLR